MTLLEKVTLRIAVEDAEIARLTEETRVNILAAKRRKTILQQVQAKLVAEPDLEALVALLSEVGVTVAQ